MSRRQQQHHHRRRRESAAGCRQRIVCIDNLFVFCFLFVHKFNRKQISAHNEILAKGVAVVIIIIILSKVVLLSVVGGGSVEEKLASQNSSCVFV